MADDPVTAARRALLIETSDCLERAFAQRGKGSGYIVELTDKLIAAVRAEPKPLSIYPDANRHYSFTDPPKQEPEQPFSERNMAGDPPNPPNLSDAAEMLWTVVANVSGGDWTQQPQYWQDAAARWRDYYFQAIDLKGSAGGARSGQTEPPQSTGLS